MTDVSKPTPQIILPNTDPDLPEDAPVGYRKYSEFRQLNRGAKAMLYACWDSVIGRTIVMKRLLPEFAHEPVERRRLLREARITAQLQHPNTVSVYDIGLINGEIYFTMKRIAGENLFKVIQRLSWGDAATAKRYPLVALLDVIIQTGLALAYAHVHGVIHRDVKPENIWLGEFGEVVLLDWGVAKVWGQPNIDGEDDPSGPAYHVVGDRAEQLQTLTRSGQRPGTPLYMSPEQVLGHRYIDERTDIFSLGIVLYEMLCFREPFRGKVVRETFDNIIHETPPLPSEVRSEAGLPASLDRIVMKALAKEPDERFQTALEMCEAIRLARHDCGPSRS